VFVDGSQFRYHDGARAEPVLCAWAITADGKPVLLSLDGANAESTDACLGFLRDLVARGLGVPLLVITDGAAGLISAVEQVWPASLRQRCLVHRVRNILAKVATADQDLVKADFWRIFDDLPAIPGEPALAEARRRAEVFAQQWGGRYPRAVACVLDDLAELTAHLRFLAEHWSRIRAFQPDRADLRRDPPPRQGHWSAPRRAVLPEPGVGGAGPRRSRLARGGLAPSQRPPAATARPAAHRPHPRRAPRG